MTGDPPYPGWVRGMPFFPADPAPPAAGPRPRGKGRPGGKKRAAVAKRFRELSGFLLERMAGLSPTARAVWLLVFSFSGGGTATVSQEVLARYAGVSVRQVRAGVRELVGAGLLEVVEQGRPGWVSVYRYHP